MRYIMSDIPSSDKYKEKLRDECDPGGSYKRVYWYKDEIPYDIDNSDNSIDPNHSLLFPTSNERIGK